MYSGLSEINLMKIHISVFHRHCCKTNDAIKRETEQVSQGREEILIIYPIQRVASDMPVASFTYSLHSNACSPLTSDKGKVLEYK